MDQEYIQQQQNGLGNSGTGISVDSYSMPKVLDYLQREWFKFEVDRSHWISEKSDLLNRIHQLESDKRINDNITNDLCRRIKMLEYALYQERLKNNNNNQSYKQTEPVFNEAKIELPNKSKENITRNLIKRYLKTIGYNDVIINKPQVFENQNYQETLEIDPKQITMLNMQQQVVTPTSTSPPINGNNIDNINLDQSLSELNKFENINSIDLMESLKQLDNINGNVNESSTPTTTTSTTSTKTPPSIEISNENNNEDESYGSLNEDFFNKLASNSKGRMKFKMSDMKGFYAEQGNSDSMNSGGSGNNSNNNSLSNNGGSIGSGNGGSIGSGGGSSSSSGSLKSKLKLSTAAASGGSSGKSSSSSMRKKLTGNLESMGMNDLNDITLEDNNKNADSAMSTRVWRYKNSLKSHFDGVRSIQFHPTTSMLLSTSEDHTIKIWDLNLLVPTKKSSTPEVDPIYTFRGHLGPVFCSSLTEDSKGFLSAGSDMIIKQWQLPPLDLDHYYKHGKVVNYLEREFVGHTDGIWDLLTLPSSNQFFSASSDGSIILWDSKTTNQLRNFIHPFGRDFIPTSLSIPPTENNRKLLASYNDGSILLFDIETGEIIQKLSSSSNIATSQDNSSGGNSNNIDCRKQINKIVSHPLLPLAITATEDQKIEFYDLNSPSPIVHSMIAHSSSISSLAIDPSGLYLASSSHDSSIRFWDISSKTCVQDLNSHRPKYDESINCIKYHPTKGYFASGGSDSVIRIHQ